VRTAREAHQLAEDTFARRRGGDGGVPSGGRGSGRSRVLLKLLFAGREDDLTRQVEAHEDRTLVSGGRDIAIRVNHIEEILFVTANLSEISVDSPVD